eukprot:1891582-Rhodomonas_salina.1
MALPGAGERVQSADACRARLRPFGGWKPFPGRGNRGPEAAPQVYGADQGAKSNAFPSFPSTVCTGNAVIFAVGAVPRLVLTRGPQWCAEFEKPKTVPTEFGAERNAVLGVWGGTRGQHGASGERVEGREGGRRTACVCVCVLNGSLSASTERNGCVSARVFYKELKE